MEKIPEPQKKPAAAAKPTTPIGTPAGATKPADPKKK